MMASATVAEERQVGRGPTLLSRMGLQPSPVEAGAAVLLVLLGMAINFDLVGNAAGGALTPLVLLAGGVVAFLWLVRMVVLVATWSRQGDCLVKHRMAWLAAPLCAALMGFAIWIPRTGDLTFEGPEWRNVTTNSTDITRWRMAADLRERLLKPGLAESEVLALLGPPEILSWGENRRHWWLKRGDESGQDWWLEVHFESALLVDTSLLEH